ncbi:hypothetical protein ARMGADRAFT_1061715 [Armillaria gallica]|uniref:Uncharacterized protein n=1 Tax=Armillaria gallica TaxID=47427 RepID=A0A2H3DPE1_ARMGA|nr:hypothetical protein ARMGADRAFT_1061715 [Armillaria gallica]
MFVKEAQTPPSPSSNISFRPEAPENILKSFYRRAAKNIRELPNATEGKPGLSSLPISICYSQVFSDDVNATICCNLASRLIARVSRLALATRAGYDNCLKVRRQVGGDDLAISVYHATVIRRSAAPDEASPFPSFPLSPTNVPTVTVRVNGFHAAAAWPAGGLSLIVPIHTMFPTELNIDNHASAADWYPTSVQAAHCCANVSMGLECAYACVYEPFL